MNIKTDNEHGRRYAGTVDCFSKIIKEGGFQALYRGFPTALAGVILFKALFMGGYDTSKVRRSCHVAVSNICLSSSPSVCLSLSLSLSFFYHTLFLPISLSHFHFLLPSFSLPLTLPLFLCFLSCFLLIFFSLFCFFPILENIF